VTNCYGRTSVGVICGVKAWLFSGRQTRGGDLRRKMGDDRKKIKTLGEKIYRRVTSSLNRSNSAGVIRQRLTADINNKIIRSTGTKHRGQVGNSLAAYLGSPGLKSGHGNMFS
jgi:hypothetical protein